MMGFPQIRMRRMRRTENLRRMVRETRLSVDRFVYPLFVVHGSGIKKEIGSMPGVYHFSVDTLLEEARVVADLGIPAVLLFGLPQRKDPMGSEAYDPEGIIQQATRALKKSLPDLIVITDVCLCEYTSHGHCGMIKNNDVDNDESLKLLSGTALSQALAGSDIVAPSDMMDGRVRAIREALDSNGLEDVAILSYSAKFASAFYGPFREAAESAPQFGNRRSYQMDPPNAREAMREIELDIGEGADIVMVKPALAYLDLIHEARWRFDLPIAAYNVSAEYSMVKAAAKMGWIDEERIMMEILNGIARSGADIIITYHAKEAARILKS